MISACTNFTGSTALFSTKGVGSESRPRAGSCGGRFLSSKSRTELETWSRMQVRIRRSQARGSLQTSHAIYPRGVEQRKCTPQMFTGPRRLRSASWGGQSLPLTVGLLSRFSILLNTLHSRVHEGVTRPPLPSRNACHWRVCALTTCVETVWK